MTLSPSSAATTLGRLARDERGNIAVIFAIALLPVLSFVGAAIDYSRAAHARTAMQGALDSAALMVAKNLSDGKITADQVPTAGAAYFAALYTHTGSQNVKASATYTANNGGKGSTVTMTASGEIKSQFMQIAGFPTLDFSVGSTSTVQLDDGTGVSPVLPKCASGSANFFMLSNPNEIDAAFTQIGTSISKLRVSK
jgi:Flp pilus assembly protein TadG